MDNLVERLREHFADCPQKSGEKSFTRSLLTEAAARITALEASLASSRSTVEHLMDACNEASKAGYSAAEQDFKTALAEAEGRVIAEVVAWLRRENGQCDCFARSEGECACGAWDDYKTKPLLDIATALETGEWKK